MAKSCRITPHVKTPQGEEVESKLYKDLKDLMSYTDHSGRANVLPLYQKTLDPQFNKDMENKGASFDENGEVTLYDFWNFTDAGKSIPESTVIQYLNETNDFYTKQNQNYNFTKEKALDAIVKFNDSQWNKRFTAKLVKKGNKFGVEINSADNTYQKRFKYYSRLSKKLSKLLEGWGIAVDDVNQLENDLTDGFINFNDIGKLPDGLIHLIKLAKGKAGDKALPEEFSHFVVRSLKNTPLIARSINQLLQDEKYKEVLGEQYEKYRQEYNNNELLLAEEALGKILAQKIENTYVNRNLIARIYNAFKNLFSKFDENQIKQVAIEADEDLNVLAQDILDGKYKNLQTTDLGNGILYKTKTAKSLDKIRAQHQQTKTRWDHFYETTLRRQNIYQKRKRELGLTAEDESEKESLLVEQGTMLQKLDIAAHHDWNKTPLKNQAGQIISKEEFRINTAIDLIDLAIRDTARIKSVVAQLREQIENNSYKGSLNSACAKVRATMDYIASYEQLLGDFNSLLKEASNDPVLSSYPEFDRIKEELQTQADELAKNLGDIKYEVIPDNKSYSFENGKYVDRKRPLAMEVLLKGLSQFVPEGAVLAMGTDLDGEIMTLEQLLMYSDNDISGASAWLNSMANTSDEIMRIYDYIVKKQKGEARIECLEIQRRIKAAGKKLEGFGFSARDHSWMYQKNDDGTFVTDSAGRPLYITDYDEKAAMQAYRLAKQDAYNRYKDLPFDERDAKIKADMKAWTDEHFERRKGETYPKASYFPSKEFLNLTKPQQDFYREFMDCKRQLDKYIPLNTKDSTTAIIVRKSALQRALTTKLFSPEFAKQIKDWFSDLFKRNVTDDEFGTTSTLVNFQGKEVNLIPIRYTQIDKNADLNNYSTNLVGNLCMYAQTATNYKALSKVVETLELGRDVLSRRLTNRRSNNKDLISRIKDGTRVLEEFLYLDKNETNFTKRLNNFMDMQVYGKLRTGKSAKGASLFSRTIGLFTTAINVFVGLTNVLQGLGQINIEMFAGKHFTMGDLLKAKKYYWQHILPLIYESGSMVKNYKLGLLSEEFNVMQEFEQDTKDSDKYERNALYRVANPGILYILNHIGEHYMQHITFLAMANHDKIYDLNGNAISLLDAYETKSVDPNNPSAGHYLSLKSYNGPNGKSQTYKTKDGKVIVTMEQLKARQASLKSQGRNIDLYSKTLLFNPDEIAEYDFKNQVSRKSAKLNQDMHGIYNEEDRNMLQQKAWGGLFMMYRKHIMPNLMKRWKDEWYDYDLATVTSGYQKTLYDKIFKTTIDSATGKKKWNLIATWTPQEKENLMRAMGQLSNWVGINLLISIMEEIGGSDDDDDSLWYAIFLVSLYRAKTENVQFEPMAIFAKHSIINEWWRLAEQPVVGMSIVERVSNLTELFDPESWEHTMQSGPYKGKKKATKIIEQSIPGFNQIRLFQKPPLEYFRNDVGEGWLMSKMFGHDENNSDIKF